MTRRENNTKASSQALADAALAYLSPSPEPAISHPLGSVPIVATPTVQAALANIYAQHFTDPGAGICAGPSTKAKIETKAPSLPSLLQYVDHVLMQGTKIRDKPPHAQQKCRICDLQWDKASVPSIFLTLSPCNHWVHYRCFIRLATGDSPHRDKCYICNKRLYEWDGISALTLATRTNLPMDGSQTTTSTSDTHATAVADKDVYEQECIFIENAIARRFFNQLTQPTGFSDNSPDLVQCYDDVLNDLGVMGRPQSKWLRWSTDNGCLLFSMLVAIKMRRFLLEGHGHIAQTEAWAAWEDWCRSLQRRILENVHKE